MTLNAYPYIVETLPPLTQTGLFTWLLGKEYDWYIDGQKNVVCFLFKEIDDAVLFKLMWC